MSEQSVAMTILDQLGGKARLVLMTGAKRFVAAPNGVVFTVGEAFKGVHKVEIRLNAWDTYDVGFYGRQGDVKAYLEGVYADQLMDTFERETGMYLTLASRSRT